MIDAQEVLREALSPFDEAARLQETWKFEVAGYRWDEPLIVQVWQKTSGGYYAMATRPELRELLSLGDSPIDALNGFSMRFRLEPKLWKE